MAQRGASWPDRYVARSAQSAGCTPLLSSHSARTGTVVDTIGCAEEAIRQATGLTPCIRHQQFATCIRVGGGQR